MFAISIMQQPDKWERKDTRTSDEIWVKVGEVDDKKKDVKRLRRPLEIHFAIAAVDRR